MTKYTFSSYVLLASLLASSGSVLSVFSSAGFYALIAGTLGAILTGLMTGMSYRIRMIDAGRVAILCIGFIILSFPAQFENGMSGDYFNLLLRLTLSGVCMLLVSASGDVEGILVNLIAVLVLMSLVGFAYSNLSDFGYTSKSTGEYEVDTILYLFNRASTQDVFGYHVYRNQGVFWEPGLLQIYANILLADSIVKKRLFCLGISILCILTTLSAAGMLIMTTVLMINFRSIRTGLILRLAIVVIGSALAAYFAYKKVFETGIVSASARLFDLMIGIDILLNNLFFGIGFDYQRYIGLASEYSGLVYSVDAERGNTNSLLTAFIFLGFIPAIFYIFFLVRQNLFVSARLAIVAIMLLASIFSPVIFMNFFLLAFVSSGCGRRVVA